MKAETINKHMQVLEVMDSPSGFVVVPVHYSHDPDKTGEDIARLRQGYDRAEDWDREMEIDFTSQLGASAYPSFNPKIHIKEEIKYRRNLPLCLACDFNVDPCVWEICQIRGGNLYVIDEISLGPTSVPKMVTEFRNRYPDHPGGLTLYGDSMGLKRTVQTERSDFQLMELHLQGYPSEITKKVSPKSPEARARINALNNRLRGHEDVQRIFISAKCVELIADLQQVVLRPDGKDILKVYKATDPYAARTHASDALGYLVHREWPLAREALKLRMKGNKRKPIVYGKLLGSI
jgi:hypothetical protein